MRDANANNGLMITVDCDNCEKPFVRRKFESRNCCYVCLLSTSSEKAETSDAKFSSQNELRRLSGDNAENTTAEVVSVAFDETAARAEAMRPGKEVWPKREFVENIGDFMKGARYQHAQMAAQFDALDASHQEVVITLKRELDKLRVENAKLKSCKEILNEPVPQEEIEKLRTENSYYSKELARLHREFNFLKKKFVTVVEQRNHYIKVSKIKHPENERYECDRTLELIK